MDLTTIRTLMDQLVSLPQRRKDTAVLSTLFFDEQITTLAVDHLPTPAQAVTHNPAHLALPARSRELV